MTPELGIALVVIIVAAFLYEMRQAASGKLTISEQVWAFCRRWSPALFLVGVLAGHLFTTNC